jgi:hypothetical protein
MSEKEIKKEEEVHKEETEKKDVDWEEQASDDEEEDQNEKKEEKEKPKKKKLQLINGEVMITKLDEYIEPPKEVKEAKGDIRDANRYNFGALINSDEKKMIKK